jgi:hypothetical protein
MRRLSQDPADRQRGQGLVELALVLPIMLLLMVSVAELGVVYGNSQTLVYAAREGARVGSALANGDEDCDLEPSVDAALVGAVQRILRSPDSGIRMNKVKQIRIFEASESGSEVGPVNVWRYDRDGDGGVIIDPGDPGDPTAVPPIAPVPPVTLDFEPDPDGPQTWPACTRVNGGDDLQSIGVTVVYTYEFVMPVASVINAVAGGGLSVELRETTVMALNPSI